MLNENLDAKLIDLGFTSQFMDTKSDHHLEQVELKMFRGNTKFASVNQMLFKSTSRRDDIISATYMFLSLLNINQFPFF